ncbi:MAG: glycosyltransferase [Candidatus Korobacteraceae bacterium]
MSRLTEAEKIPILLLVRELGIGGTERQLVETARYLKGTAFVPHVACFRPDGLRKADLVDAQVPILEIPIYSFRSLDLIKGARLLLRYIRDHRIQIVHSFDAPLNVFAAPLAWLSGDPAVVTSQRAHRDLAGTQFKWLLRITDLLADAIVVNCQWMSHYLREKEGVPESKVRLCYNAIDIRRYRRLQTPNLPSDSRVIGTVCALRPEKAVDTLLHAFAQVEDLNTRLLIVGSGPQEQYLRSLAGELSLESRCHFEPATADVTKWLSQIDIFVLPSRFEALSNALMEAMACGCCPVATRVGGNPELIEDGYNGLLFTVDDASELAYRISSLLKSPSQIKVFGERASSKMAEFTDERSAHTMQSIYESVLSAKRRAGARLTSGNR